MKKSNKFKIGLIMAVVLLTTWASISSFAHTGTRLDEEIETVFKDRNMTAMSIAVVSDDSIIYTKSLGYRVLPDESHNGIPVKDDDMFCLASVSKTFIATTIMALVQDKRLSLNDNAEKHLKFRLRNPKYPSVPITIKQLLTHTSSINDSYSWCFMDSINPELTDNYYKCYSDTRPGRDYKYCNLNYTLLSAIIENATGKPLDSVVDSIIMKPLNIHGGFNTILLDEDRIVTPYYRENGKIKINDYVIKRYNVLKPGQYKLNKSVNIVYSPAGMKISAPDLARFMMMHMDYGSLNGKKVLTRKSELDMQRNYVGENNYGLSFRQYDDLVQDKILHGQTGGIPGVKTCMIFDPESRTGYVIVTAGADSDYIDGYGDIHKPLIKSLHKHLIENAERH